MKHSSAKEHQSKRITEKDKEILTGKLAGATNLSNDEIKHCCHDLEEE